MFKKGMGISIGAPLQLRKTWNLEEGSYTGDFERWRALATGHLSLRDSMKGTWREGSFTGDPKRCQVRLWKWVAASSGPAFGEHGGVVLGNMKGRFFLGLLTEKIVI
jgi:hypothetical protein